VLNVVGQLLHLVKEHTLWFYVACLAIIGLYVRSYIVARRERTNTSFTIEKEVAVHREGRALTGIGVMLGVIAVLTILKFYIVPWVDVSALLQPTPTHTLPIPTVWNPTPTPDVGDQPTATPRPIPTQEPAPVDRPTEPPAPTPAPPPACPDPNVRIVSPGMDAPISGVINITGTATHPQFHFYKVEYGLGDEPTSWHVIDDLRYSAVVGGVLVSVDSRALPNGTAWFRLTVVDQTGNYPPPCAVRVSIRN